MTNYTLTFDETRRCFVAALEGPFTGARLLEVRDAIRAHEEWVEPFSVLVDVRNADLSQFNIGDIGEFHGKSMPALAKRMMVVVGTEMQFGIVRQFFGHASPEQAYELLVTRSEQEALAFADELET